MRMFATIKFNRVINVSDEKSEDYLSFGGYEMKINGKKFNFDFDEYYGKVDKDDKTILHIEQRWLSEELLSEKDIEYLENTPLVVSHIGEFCCFSPNDIPLEIAEIIELCFENKLKEYTVRKDVIQQAEIVYTS